MQEYRQLYELFVQTLKKAKLIFSYLVVDELYTYIGKKRRRYYVWTALAVTSTGKKFYFYLLSKERGSGALFHFKTQLPQTPIVYTDGNAGYRQIFGNKATMQKSAKTNLIENLNSQLRDKISYLVRRTKAHA